MASEIPSKRTFLGFNCIDALKKVNVPLGSVNQSGPFNLKYLNQEKLEEFERLCQEFEETLLGGSFGFKEIRAQLDPKMSLEQLKEKAAELSSKFQLTWHLETGQKLASPTFWQRLFEPLTDIADQTRLEILRTKWFLHAKWAHLPSQKLVHAREVLVRIKTYAENARKELDKHGKRRIKIPYIGKEIPQPFFERYHRYLTSLQEKISGENKILAEAMQARLELAAATDLQNDDLVYDLVTQLNKKFKVGFLIPVIPRKTLESSVFPIFHHHILETSDEVLLKRLSVLPWMNPYGKIPCHLEIHDSQMSLYVTHQNLKAPTNTRNFFEFAKFYVAFDTITKRSTISPREELYPCFSTCFLFLQTEITRLVGQENWNKILALMTKEILDYTQKFLRFLPSDEENIPNDYYSFLSTTRNFCLFINKASEKKSAVNDQILEAFEKAEKGAIEELFRNLAVFNLKKLTACLNLLEAIDPRISPLKKLLLEEIEVPFSDLEQCLKCFVPEKELYTRLELLLKKTYSLRNEKLSPSLLRLFQAFREKHNTDLMKSVIKNSEVKIEAAIKLLEDGNIQETPIREFVNALTLLSSFGTARETIVNFIYRYLKQDACKDFIGLDIILFGTEEQIERYAAKRIHLLIDNPSNKASFEHIFQHVPQIRHSVTSFLFPIIRLDLDGDPLEWDLDKTLELIHLLEPSKRDEFLKRLDDRFFTSLEQIYIQKAIEIKGVRFLKSVWHNFPQFPCTEEYRNKLNRLNEKIILDPWSVVGYQICSHFTPGVLPYYHLQLLRLLLHDTSFADVYLNLCDLNHAPNLLNIPPGLAGIRNFYSEKHLPEVLKELIIYLQAPKYHPITHRLVARHLASKIDDREESTAEFNKLSAQFESYDAVFKKALEALRELRANNLGNFKNCMNELHTKIIRAEPSQAILVAYIKLLEKIEEELRSSLYGPENDRTRYLIETVQAQYSTSKESVFRSWLERKMASQELFDEFLRLSQRLSLVIENAEEIKTIFRSFVHNIHGVYAAEEDWILHFPQERVAVCLNILSFDEKNQLLKALSFLNVKKYSILSKDALDAFKRLLRNDTDNQEKDLKAMSDATISANACKRYRLLRSEEEKNKFREELLREFTDRPEFSEKLLKTVLQDASEISKKEDRWEGLVSVLFPGIPEGQERDCYTVHSYLWGVRRIHPEVFAQLFDENGILKKTVKEYNRHFVTPVYIQPNVVHIKFLPDAVGIHWNARNLSRLIFEDVFPHCEILKFPPGTADQEKGYPVLMTEHIPGLSVEQAWRQNEHIEVDPESFSQEFIKNLLDREQDDGPQNRICFVLKNGKCSLISIEKENSFGDTVKKEGDSVTLLQKSVLYCFEEMNRPVHPKTQEAIRKLDIFDCINYFISDAANYNNKVSLLFDFNECQYWADKKTTLLFPLLTSDLIKKTIKILTKLKELFNANPQITHIQVLKIIFPELAPFYGTVLKEPHSPQYRFNKVLGNQFILVHGSYISLQNHAHIYISAFGHVPTSAHLSNPPVLEGSFQDKLRSVEQQIRALMPVRGALEKGDFSSFRALPRIDLKEKVLNGIEGYWPPLKISKLPPKVQKDFLNELTEHSGFECLDFSDMQLDVLDNSIYQDQIEKILIKQPCLKSLNLSRCIYSLYLGSEFFPPLLLHTLAEFCPELEILKLSGCDIGYLNHEVFFSYKESLKRNPIFHPFIQRALAAIDFSKPFGVPLMVEASSPSKLKSEKLINLKKLKHLYVDNCPDLESITLVAPNLEHLHARGCSKLKNLRILTFRSANASLDGCDALNDKEYLTKNLHLSCYSNVKFYEKELTLVIDCMNKQLTYLDILSIDATLSTSNVKQILFTRMINRSGRQIPESFLLNLTGQKPQEITIFFSEIEDSGLFIALFSAIRSRTIGKSEDLLILNQLRQLFSKHMQGVKDIDRNETPQRLNLSVLSLLKMENERLIEFRGYTLRRLKTKEDNFSAVHALLGTENNQGFLEWDKGSRKIIAERLSSKIKDSDIWFILSPFFIALSLSKESSEFDTGLKIRLNNQIKSIKEILKKVKTESYYYGQLIKTFLPLVKFFESKSSEIFNQFLKLNSDLISIEDAIMIHRHEIIEWLFYIYPTNFTEPSLKEEFKEIGMKFKENIEVFLKTEIPKDVIVDELHSIISSCFSDYIEKFKDESYFITYFELKIIAKLYQKDILIINSEFTRFKLPPQTIPNDCIVILQEGRHFERCEKLLLTLNA